MTTPPAPVADPAPPARKRGVVAEALLALPNLGRLMWGLARDQRVGWVDKSLVVGAALYFVMPLDVVPDFLPFFGEVDDLVLLLLAVRRLIRRAGPEVVLAHWKGDPEWLTDGKLAKLVGVASAFLPGARRARR
ncbi:MAG: DUF1232 domain-containing protein [Gemmatimonadetes bacterium]|nr:DUF1232 domain-containing protein [Gemmatimonadota bacterium]